MTMQPISGDDPLASIAQAVFDEVRRAAPEGLNFDLTLDSSLAEVGLESLARMHVVNCLEVAFHIRFTEDALYDIDTCRDLVEYIAAKTASPEARWAPVAPAAMAKLPGKTEDVTERRIAPEWYEVEQFPECVALAQRLADTAAIGLENPFFRVKERVERATVQIDGCDRISYTSFDYLGMARDPRVAAAAKTAIDRFGTSASASRLVGGNNPIVEQLDKTLATFLGVPAAVSLPSGYGVNASALGHLFGSEDFILYDELAHNSIVQGSMLSQATRRAFPHNDFDFVNKLLGEIRRDFRRVVIVVEGVYSMDGDYPDLPRLLELKRRHRALLYIDEAHSLGVLGPSGRGIFEHFGIDPCEGDLGMGTISKALASGGGFLAGRKTFIQYMKYTTPANVFATALSPANAAAALASLSILEKEPERVERLRSRSDMFLRLAKQLGLDTGPSGGTSIVPVVVGNSQRTLAISAALLRRGIDAQPILYPAVPESKSRIRFFLTSEHTEEQIRRTVQVLADCIAASRGVTPQGIAGKELN
jgi:8-amino-7-oxononanoate synthase